MPRTDIKPCDVFISWTGTDSEIKKQIADTLRMYGMEPLLSDEHCQGDFVEWSCAAATSAHIFMTIITENALESKGMEWELEEIDKKLCSDEGAYWKNAIIPVCQSLEVFAEYKAKFPNAKPETLEKLSAIIMKTDENGKLTQESLDEICRKTSERIIYHMPVLYRENTKPSFIKLISLYDIDVADTEHSFEKLYIQRKITEFDKNKQALDNYDNPKELLSGEHISFIYGPAGCGKSQYISQIRLTSTEDDFVMSLSCADVSADSHELSDIMFAEYSKICGNKRFYTKDFFIRLLQTKRLILVLDGMDEITTKNATRNFVEKIGEYYKANSERTTLIFTGRNEKDSDVLVFGDKNVRRFRLDKLTDEEIERLGSNLFMLFQDPRGDEFYVRVKDLNDEIRSNPMLLSQLAIIYKDRGDIPKTLVGILDAVSSITLSSDVKRHRNLQAIPAKYKEMIDDIGMILKSFAREKYEKAAEGKSIEFTKMFSHILKERYGERGDILRSRTEFLLEYLGNRAIFADGNFYHKMFLEYFASVSYYEEAFDEDYGEIEDSTVIDSLFCHYSDGYWKDVIKLFLVKADSCIDGVTTEELYRHILSDAVITDYSLLFDVCRELIVHKKEASIVLVSDILEKSINGKYPAYGPLFWYVPEYELYESAVLAAEKLFGNAKALALVRDVCFIFGRKYTVADVTDEVDGEALYLDARNGLSGVRAGLVELFCTGKTDCTLGADIYPRCFNVAEAKHFTEFGYGMLGRMSQLFEDELGLWEESYPVLGGEYIGFVSCKYNRAEMERRLSEKPTSKVCGLALINSSDTEMDYVHFLRSSVRIMYIPENTKDIRTAFDRFMRLELSVKETYISSSPAYLRRSAYKYDKGIFYIPYDLRKVIIPKNSCEFASHRFEGLELLEEVRLSHGLERIGFGDFAHCRKLRSISIPDSVADIGAHAFDGCTSLRCINIPNSVTQIRACTFKWCTSLDNITVPNSVTEIKEGAFYGCSSLSRITLPTSVTKIENEAFKDCAGLRHIILPDSITEIGCNAFEGCTNLQSVSLPASITKIPDSLFKNCTKLHNVIIPDSVTAIGWYAFEGCSSLSNITIPDSVSEIGESAFKNCLLLSDIRLPDSIDTIKWWTFEGCESLSSFTIPDSVTKLGCNVFKGCTNLKRITVPLSLSSELYKLPSSTEIICKETGLAFSDNELSVETYIEEGRTSLSEGEFAHSSIEKIHIPHSLLYLNKSAFEGCTRLIEITIPDSVRIIPWAAFKDCSALENIIIPHSVTAIDFMAFQGCTALRSINLPNTVNKISMAAFKNCTSLRAVTIPDSVTQIESRTFQGCTNLQKIAIPPSVTYIGTHAFEQCSTLESITLPSSITQITDSAFKDCISLGSISIPGSVEKIGSYVFKNCKSLVEVTLSESITSIREGTFDGCTSLRSICIPRYVERISMEAFFGCTSLESVVLSGAVKEINWRAFKGCIHLASIALPKSVTEIGAEAFMDCLSLTDIEIPENVRLIGKNAFAGCTGLTSVTLSANFKNDVFRIFGDIDESILHFL